jgi:predicted nucleic acid-binding protein
VTRAFVDTNVPLYAVGGESPRREPCRRVLTGIARGEIDGWTNVQVLQEVLHRCLQAARAGQPEALGGYDDFLTLFPGRVIPIDANDLVRARELAHEHEELPSADLVHLATMERHEIGSIITADRHFDGIKGLERLDPAKLARRLSRR